jgi:hypothetical protein
MEFVTWGRTSDSLNKTSICDLQKEKIAPCIRSRNRDVISNRADPNRNRLSPKERTEKKRDKIRPWNTTANNKCLKSDSLGFRFTCTEERKKTSLSELACIL